ALVQADGHPVLVPHAEVDSVAALAGAAGHRIECPDHPQMELRIVWCEAVERLHTLDRPQREVPATVRRHLAYLEAGEARALRRHPLCQVLSEIVGRERGRRVLRDWPAVELLDALQCFREARLPERAFRQEDVRRLLVALEKRCCRFRDSLETRRPR